MPHAVLVSVSSGGTLLRSWDIASGYLQWEVAIHSSHDPSSFDNNAQVDGGWSSDKVKVALSDSKHILNAISNGIRTSLIFYTKWCIRIKAGVFLEDVILILSNGKLTAVNCKKGNKLWSVEVNSE